MYGKIFDSIYDGTLAEDWRALITFQQMIVLCDADGIVDMTAAAISRRTGIPIEHIKAGIEILENPDPYSRTEGEEGCRIKRMDEHRPWGWYIVNHEKYKNLQDSDTVRAQNRERKRRQREREKGHEKSRDVTQGHTPSRHTDTDTNTDKKNIRAQLDSLGVKEGVWADFMQHRKQLKSTMTDRAINLAISTLAKLKQEGFDPNEVIEQSILNGWKGLFALKTKSTTTPSSVMEGVE